MYFLDKFGYPIESIRGRWFRNFLRKLIHTRKVGRGKWTPTRSGIAYPCSTCHGCSCMDKRDEQKDTAR